MNNRSKNRVIYSELRVSFKNGKHFTYKRVLRYGFYKDNFEIITKTFDDPYMKKIPTENILKVEEHLKRQITQKNA